MGKANWFREEADQHTELESREWPRVCDKRMEQENRRVETVHFSPHTPGGALRRLYMQVEEKIASEKGKVKYVESMGLTIGQTLIRKDPWGGHCNRDNCMPCMAKEGRCTREGVIYLMTCLKCKETGQKVHYVGESARCGYDRGAEHWRALQ